MLQGLSTKWAGQDFRYLEVTGSTNEDCFRFLGEGAPHGVVVVAGQQLSGKGRRGRSWSSPAGDSLYMSIGLKPEVAPERASMLTLVMALAVCRAIGDVLPEKGKHAEVGIKWPNDIVMDGRKVCGILTEMHLCGNQIEHVVLGVGINVGRRVFEEDIQGVATSLFAEGAEESCREMLLAAVLRYFEAYYEEFVKKCDMSTIMEEYVEKLVNKDKEVTVLDPQGEYRGTALGIDRMGQLLVRKECGAIEAVYAGEVSVRGIYGYV